MKLLWGCIAWLVLLAPALAQVSGPNVVSYAPGGNGNATQVNGAAVPASQACLGSNASSQLIAGTCSGGGSGTVNTGTTNYLAYYAANGTAVSPLQTLLAAQMPALTGDVTNTAGSLSTTVGKINGAAVPASAAFLASNASNQLIAATLPVTVAQGGTGTTTGAITATNGAGYTLQNVSGSITTGTTGFGDNWVGTVNDTSAVDGIISFANITCTTCTATSYLVDWQVGGASKFNVTTAGAVTVGNTLTVAGGTATLNSVNLSANTTVAYGFSHSSSGVATFVNSAVVGNFITTSDSISEGIISSGTTFTAAGTGCTVGTRVGGATAGTFTLATGPCTAVVVTMGGATASVATNGWSCQAHDRTSPTVLIGGESASTTTTATITIPAGAGTADVISFSCTGY